jgi:hypothetical protein
MSLFTITFDSSSESISDESPIPVRPPSKSKGPLDNIVLFDDVPRLKPGRHYRDLTAPSPCLTPSQHFSDPRTYVTFARSTSTKLNGVRIFFIVFDNGQQLFLAKAKSPTAKSIPITNDFGE